MFDDEDAWTRRSKMKKRDIFGSEKPEWLERWQLWLMYEQKGFKRLLDKHEKQVRRLCKMFGNDVRPYLETTWTMPRAGAFYCRNYGKYGLFYDLKDGLRKLVSEMESVREPEDVQNIKGIGKKRAEKLIAGIAKR